MHSTDVRLSPGYDSRLSIDRRIRVRPDFTQQADWRSTFGYRVPLYIAVASDSSMDAPVYVPSGGTDYRGSACSVALRSEGVYE